MPCANCNSTGKVGLRGAPCPNCSDSGTPDLDLKLGRRYAAGIDRDGRLVRPIEQCLTSMGTVRYLDYRDHLGESSA